MSKSHYLEKLLDGAEVEWVPLDEVATLKRGRVMSKGYLRLRTREIILFTALKRRMME